MVCTVLALSSVLSDWDTHNMDFILNNNYTKGTREDEAVDNDCKLPSQCSGGSFQNPRSATAICNTSMRIGGSAQAGMMKDKEQIDCLSQE